LERIENEALVASFTLELSRKGFSDLLQRVGKSDAKPFFSTACGRDGNGIEARKEKGQFLRQHESCQKLRLEFDIVAPSRIDFDQSKMK
jgi:hypothetical protein